MNKYQFCLIVVLLSIVIYWGSASVQAQENGEEEIVATLIADATVIQDSDDALAELVSTQGMVRVIVELNLEKEFQPEGALPNNIASAQRSEIATVQQTLQSSFGRSSATTVRRTYATLPLMALTVNGTGLEQLLASNLVKNVFEDVPVPPSLNGTVGIIGADDVVANGYDGTDQTVVILDTGIDGDHPFFADDSGTSRIVTEACFSTTDGTYNSSSLCPNGSDVQTGSGASEVDTTANCFDGSSQLCYHGVHVAGIAAGNGTYAGVGYDGVAPNANIVSVQVFSRFEDDAYCGTGASPCILSFTSDQLAALEYVYDSLHGVYDVASVNMSLGGGEYESACDTDSRKGAIDNLLSVGIATVIAAGNDGYTAAVGAPACISTAVTVGATTNSDGVASYSNLSADVDLFAPGSNILSSYPDGAYNSISGTSMATPHVAGAWALMKQRSPDASVINILEALQENGVSITDTRSGGSITKERIQVDDAIDKLRENIWDGSTSDDWHTASNWSENGVPTGFESVVIPSSLSRYPTISADAAVGKLTIESGAAVTMTAGTLTSSIGWDEQAGGLFNGTGGTVQLLTPFTINQADGSFFNHIVIGDGVYETPTLLESDLDVAGNLNLQENSEFEVGSQTVSLSGNWLNDNGLFSADTGTIHFSGVSQVISDTSPTLDILIDQDFGDYDGSCGCTGTPPTGWATSTDGGYGFLFGNAWSSGSAVLWDNTTSPDSGWLFTPALELSQGVVYTLSFATADYDNAVATPVFTVDVYLGDAQAEGDMTTHLVTSADAGYLSYATTSIAFTVSTDGTYYLGFDGEQSGTYGFLDDILLTTSGEPTFEPYNMEVSSTEGVAMQVGTAVQNNLTVNVDGLLNLNGNELTVENSITNNGGMQDTLYTPETTWTSFIDIFDAAGTTAKYQGAEVRAPGNSLGDTTVTVYGNQSCVDDGVNSFAKRCFEIVPTTERSSRIRLYYDSTEANSLSESAVNIYQWDSTEWVKEAGNYNRSDGGESSRYVQVRDVDSYGLFAIAEADPTAVVSSMPLDYTFAADTLSLAYGAGYESCVFDLYRSSAPYDTAVWQDNYAAFTADDSSLSGVVSSFYSVATDGCDDPVAGESVEIGVFSFGLESGE